jgi:glucose/arabinose dehydrogenase
MGDAAMNWTAQDPNSLGGKVLRITTDGAGAPGNPGGALRPEIFTYGHRNPQGIAFRWDGIAFEVEHGTDRDDELNVLVPGGNYGWDPKPPGGGSLYDESRPMTDLAKFPTAHVAIWSSGFPTIAPSGGTFITGAQWGPWQDKFAMAVLKGQQLRVFAITGSNVVIGEGIAITDRGRLRIAVQNVDGSLWLATDANPGSILRVAPA